MDNRSMSSTHDNDVRDSAVTAGLEHSHHLRTFEQELMNHPAYNEWRNRVIVIIKRMVNDMVQSYFELYYGTHEVESHPPVIFPFSSPPYEGPQWPFMMSNNDQVQLNATSAYYGLFNNTVPTYPITTFSTNANNYECFHLYMMQNIATIANNFSSISDGQSFGSNVSARRHGATLTTSLQTQALLETIGATLAPPAVSLGQGLMAPPDAPATSLEEEIMELDLELKL
ncbi:hypothetical protein RIF29_12177 [Crotalaria pallida]|uniref:Uncharacterized protein n=1 Tax=Crotalaria pallida TaxID=3830 RepID=A0AAN9IMW6_CROPI